MSGRRSKALRRMAEAIDPGAPAHTTKALYRILKRDHKAGRL